VTYELCLSAGRVPMMLLVTMLQTGDFAQGYENAVELVITVFLAIAFFALISWLTKRRSGGGYHRYPQPAGHHDGLAGPPSAPLDQRPDATHERQDE
jgi:hypothetical protein